MNNRARDIVDLALLKGLAERAGSPSADDIKAAAEDIFEFRADEARQLGRPARRLPVTVVAYPHWAVDYEDAAKSADLAMRLDDAVALVNAWLRDIGIGG